ncbi:protein secE/sec61-gamma protein [Diplocarpon rosae]|nr:protein secE/sec61-gamma protein [Diplocarpon rosae]
MSDQIQEVLDIPRDFVREGTQFINKCTKPDRREFIKISQAVGVGFLVMGAVGSHPSQQYFGGRRIGWGGLYEGGDNVDLPVGGHSSEGQKNDHTRVIGASTKDAGFGMYLYGFHGAEKGTTGKQTLPLPAAPQVATVF